MTKEQITLYFREGTSDKVYHASIDERNGGFVVQFAFGRRGSTLQTGTKTPAPVPYEKAKAVYDKLVIEKMNKGYTPGPDGTPYQHTDKEARDSGVRCQLLNPVTDEQAAELIESREFWMQEKKDGQRVLLKKDGNAVRGINRKGLAIALPAPLVACAKQIAGSFLLDGESVGDTYHAFDLLSLNDNDLRARPHNERLKQLTNLLANVKGKAIVPIETATTPHTKRTLFERLKKQKAEGVVFKHCAAPSTPGRPSSTGTWLKYKFFATASLIVAKHNDKHSVALELHANRKERVQAGNVTIPPNVPLPPVGAVIEVRYLYAYKESGHLYQPTFLRVRDDLEPAACTTTQLKYRAPQEDDEA